MIQMAMEPYMGSPNNGAMPRMVVSEAMTTGRTREVVAVTTAS